MGRMQVYGNVLEHIGNLGGLLGEILATCELDLEVYGSPTAELVEATAELAPRIYSAFLSL